MYEKCKKTSAMDKAT